MAGEAEQLRLRSQLSRLRGLPLLRGAKLSAAAVSVSVALVSEADRLGVSSAPTRLMVSVLLSDRLPLSVTLRVKLTLGVSPACSALMALALATKL